MKRSEAVKIIKKSLTRWNGAYYDESLESYILTQLEDAGILPPNKDVSIYIPPKPEIFEGIERFMQLHNWEDE